MKASEVDKKEFIKKLERVDSILNILSGSGSRWDDERAYEGSNLIEDVKKFIEDLQDESK